MSAECARSQREDVVEVDNVDVQSNMSSQDTRTKLLHENRRAREFYRYYQPIRELTKCGPPLCDLADAASVEAHRAFSCPDRALTAFCQLGALRLQTRRCMMFFFDSQYAYVLAEATRTLSLQDDSVHELEDSLWLGHTMIPRGYSVCEHTVLLSPNQISDDSTSMVHIVNDLSEDTRFCDRPFVTGGPRARFYAGVPITTPKGINIGAYCVLDDKQRDGLDQASMLFLRDMSATVMTHLEMVRAQAEHRIGTQMVAGLGAFIDGADGFRDWAEKNEDWNLEESDPILEHPMGTHHMTSTVSAVAQAAVAAGEQLQEERLVSLSVPSYAKQHRRSRTVTASNGSSLQRSAKTPSTLAGKRSTDSIRDPATTHVQKTFGRAATLIREAMDVEGVLFFDAAISTFGGLVDAVETVSNTEMSSDHGSATEQTGTGTEGEEIITKKTDKGEDVSLKQCCLLASSCVEPRIDPDADRYVSKTPTQITEKFLRTLLRRYPRGKVWIFNENGDASSDDDESSEYSTSTDSKTCRCLPGDRSSNGKAHSGSCSKRRRQSRVDDSKEIARLFPGVRSLGLVGMWDHTRQRWYAACAFYTYSPLRLFSEESEIKYMAAFCDVILAELHRLEAQTSDKAKSDFISTMSHELRSPLHGILGSVECLQEQPTDNISADLISQVDICGRTLLDIIDHLLDFSKINHHAKSRGGIVDAKGRRMSSNAAKRSRMGGMMTLSADVALDQVTEEVVETAVYSFCCSRDPASIEQRKVAVILDIDRSATIDWKCYVAVGAWKRIAINLVSNALKYTSKGHIRISLKASPIPEKRKRFNVTLSVTDTGRGMSKDFLENHLFRAFQQEDSFVEGTGLGMNLVAKIVKAFEGKIDVQSEQGVGTCFSVTLPLEHSRIGRDLAPKQSIAGVCVAIIDPTTASQAAPIDGTRNLLLSSICRTLEEAGAGIAQSDWNGNTDADVYFVLESDLLEEMRHLEDSGYTGGRMPPEARSNRPYVVLCDNALSARKIRTSGLGLLASEHVELISQPAGPERVAKAILSCLHNKREVIKATDLAGAVKDLPVLVPHPDRTPSTQPLRSSYHSASLVLGSRRAPLRREKSQSPEGTNRMPHVRFHRGLSSEERFPRVPTPTLSGGKLWPRNDGAASPDLQETSSNAGSGVSLLLVDDNPINLRLLVTYAEKNGHHKTIATDGLQAVEVYKQACLDAIEPKHSPGISGHAIPSVPKPQVILMDINMPIQNGFEATRQIRGFEQQRGLQPATIIALTGLGSASAQQEAFSSGVDLFLTKPVRLKELTKVIDGLKKA